MDTIEQVRDQLELMLYGPHHKEPKGEPIEDLIHKVYKIREQLASAHSACDALGLPRAFGDGENAQTYTVRGRLQLLIDPTLRQEYHPGQPYPVYVQVSGEILERLEAGNSEPVVLRALQRHFYGAYELVLGTPELAADDGPV